MSRIPSLVASYQLSPEFRHRLEALAYFQGRNPRIQDKRIVKLQVSHPTDGSSVAGTREIIGNRISSRFFYRFVTQQNQHLLGNGMLLKEKDQKALLGFGFDTVLQQIGELALIQGVAYGFWNASHLEKIEAAKDPGSGFLPLVDEQTGQVRAGIQFWQLSETRPRYFRVFEEDGWALYRLASQWEVITPKTPYRSTVRVDGLGSQVVSQANYATLPIVPLYANPDQVSELSENLKSKIDLYDVILSDFGDNLERTNDIYWVINNFGGTSDQILEMLEEIDRIRATYTQSNGAGQSTAEPHTIEVPYAARQTALELLERALYKDAMALDLEELSGGGLTNVAIRAAMKNLNLKCDRYEWQVFQFCQALLPLVGIPITEQISFPRQVLENVLETVQALYIGRADLSRREVLKLHPMIPPEDIDQTLSEVDAETMASEPTMDDLQAQIDRLTQSQPPTVPEGGAV